MRGKFCQPERTAGQLPNETAILRFPARGLNPIGLDRSSDFESRRFPGAKTVVDREGEAPAEPLRQLAHIDLAARQEPRPPITLHHRHKRLLMISDC